MEWDTRPVEIANLLNPAFYSLVLREAAKGYEGREKAGMPYSLLFLVPSIVLYKKTRDSLPNRNSSTSFGKWVMKSDKIVIGFANRTRQYTPYTKEALLFGIHHGVIRIDQNTGNVLPYKELHLIPWSSNSTPKECLNKAKLIGQWFADVGDPTSIYRALGVRP